MKNESSNQPIGVFDSGTGGLSTLRAIVDILPHEDIVYIADNKNMPFGEKTPEQLMSITEKITSYLVNQHNVKLAVIACNTATVPCIGALRKRFNVPFVGVVPVVKPACEQTKSKRVAILASPLTAGSDYLIDLIAKFGDGIEVFRVPCSGLADLIDKGAAGTLEAEEALREFVGPALAQGADVIGLCCTHYTFACVREQLQKIVGPEVTILDSNVPVARQVKRVLAGIPGGLSADDARKPVYQFFVTKQPAEFELVAQKLVGQRLVSGVKLVIL